MKTYLVYSALAGGLLGSSVASGQLRINEFVTDPQMDRNGDGIITGSDEFFEIVNRGAAPVDLNGLELYFIDTTPSGMSLSRYGLLQPGQMLTITNPEGEQNNNGELYLLRISDNVRLDDVVYGNWPGNVDSIPNSNSTAPWNESLSRYPDGASAWYKTWATPNEPNVPESGALALMGLAGILASKRKR